MTALKAWCWALEPGQGPPLAAAFHLGHATRRALVWRHQMRGFGDFPSCFYRSEDHSHAAYYSEDRDGDGLIDRLSIFARSGIPPTVIRAAADIDHIACLGHRLNVTLEYAGPQAPFELQGPAHVWRTVTPFITPLHATRSNKGGKRTAKAGAKLPDQIATLLGQQGLHDFEIELAETSWAGDDILIADAVASFGLPRDVAPPPADASAAFVTLTFDEPVEGPLALGYGSHFGLGLFTPLVMA